MQERDVVRAGNSRLRRRKRKIFFRKSSLLLALFVIVVGGLIFLSWRPFLQIKEVSVAGINVLPENELLNEVEDVLGGRYLLVFPKRNIFLAPQRALEKNLKITYPRIETIDIDIDTKRKLNIVLTEREGQYLWCDGVSVSAEQEQSDCYYMDDRGKIFDKAPYFSAGNIYFSFYGNISDDIEDQILGERYLSMEEFMKLTSFIDSLDKMDIKSFACKEEGDDFILYLGTKKSSNMPYMSWRRDIDMAHLKSNVDSAFATEPFKTRYKDDFASLEYIDLRFENKVYYKFKPTF